MDLRFLISQNTVTHVLTDGAKSADLGDCNGTIESRNGFSGFYDWLVSPNDSTDLVGVEFFPFDEIDLLELRIPHPSRVGCDGKSLILFLRNSERPYSSLGTQSFYDGGFSISDSGEFTLTFSLDLVNDLVISEDGLAIHGEFE